MLDIHFKHAEPDAAVRRRLSENDLRMEFSAGHKLYYSLMRPLLPIALRQVLQRRVSDRIACRPDFIWSELVEHMQRDAAAWSRFTAALYPPGFTTAIVLTHDVETQTGYDFIPKVIELEQRYGFRSSWNLVAHKYELRPEITDAIVAAGHEIGIHGYNHDGTLYYSRQRFRFRVLHINQALKKYGAVGFRSPQVHRDLEWLQELDVLYDASCFDYDPYQPFPGGTGSIWPFMAGKFVELPYTLPQDHTLFYVLRSPDMGIWRRKVEWLAANHGMILALTHPDYLIEPAHLARYEELLSVLREVRNAWHCLPREMAQRYRSL